MGRGEGKSKTRINKARWVKSIYILVLTREGTADLAAVSGRDNLAATFYSLF